MYFRKRKKKLGYIFATKIIVNMNEDTTQLSIQDETFLDTACQQILSLDIKGSLFGASCLNVETKHSNL